MKEVLDSSGLFPSEYLDEMISGYLENVESQELWFTFLDQDKPVAIGYCTPEKLTDGTYNLLAIGVKKSAQRTGIATKMMDYIEAQLRAKNGRILIVETSSAAEQGAARHLYQKLGYTQEAIIRDFWKEGEHKIVFWKRL